MFSFSKNKNSIKNRRFDRYDCSVIAYMLIPHKTLELDGLVTEISEGGLNFRTATTYILDRTGTEVRVEFEGLSLTGVIVATRASGYGVRLHSSLPLNLVRDIAQKYGLQNGLKAA